MSDRVLVCYNRTHITEEGAPQPRGSHHLPPSHTVREGGVHCLAAQDQHHGPGHCQQLPWMEGREHSDGDGEVVHIFGTWCPNWAPPHHQSFTGLHHHHTEYIGGAKIGHSQNQILFSLEGIHTCQYDKEGSAHKPINHYGLHRPHCICHVLKSAQKECDQHGSKDHSSMCVGYVVVVLVHKCHYTECLIILLVY